MTSTASIWVYAEVNPRTPEFAALEEGNIVSFVPLEAVWPDGNADFSRTLEWKNSLSYTEFRRGDVLVPKITPTFEAGRSCIAHIPHEVGLASTEVHVLRARENADARFLSYVVRSIPFLDEGAHSLQGVGNLRRITPGFLASFQIPETSLETQRAIADYLDRETTEIDSMLADLDELVTLLIARRRTLLNELTADESFPHAPVGVVAQVKLGKMVENTNAEVGSFPYLRAAHVQPGGVLDLTVSEKLMPFTEPELDQLSLQRGDVVVVEGGAGYGRSALLERDLPGWGFQNSILRVRAEHSKLCPKYLQMALEQALVSGEIELVTNTATLPHFTAEKLARFRIPCPPLNVQIERANEWDSVSALIGEMLSDAADLKSLLLERRSALISDVVTGRKQVV